MSEENGESQTPKRNALPWETVRAMIAGIDSYDKASFLVVGHRGGTRIAIPKTSTGVSRAYFYGEYAQVPAVPAVKTYTPEERRQLHRGGIIAEVEFEAGLEQAQAALAALIEVVRVAPAPAPRGEKKPRVAKEPKPPRDPLGETDK